MIYQNKKWIELAESTRTHSIRSMCAHNIPNKIAELETPDCALYGRGLNLI